MNQFLNNLKKFIILKIVSMIVLLVIIVAIWSANLDLLTTTCILAVFGVALCILVINTIGDFIQYKTIKARKDRWKRVNDGMVSLTPEEQKAYNDALNELFVPVDGSANAFDLLDKDKENKEEAKNE